MFEMPITRVICKFDFLNVPSFATRCLKNSFLLLIHNYFQIDWNPKIETISIDDTPIDLEEDRKLSHIKEVKWLYIRKWTEGKKGLVIVSIYTKETERERESFYDNVIFVTRVVSMNELFS